jgi:hypothetical protein
MVAYRQTALSSERDPRYRRAPAAERQVSVDVALLVVAVVRRLHRGLVAPFVGE